MKTVVITGSTRGIGLGLARNFLLAGCKVVLSGRSASVVEQRVAELAQEFGADKVAGKACDVTQAEDLSRLWACAEQAFGQVNIWINNAGISIARKSLDQQSDADIAAIVSTNLTGVLLANKVVLEKMKAAGFGQIWNMEGFGSNGQTAPGMVAYGATKRAITYINRALQKEVKGTAVQVCNLSPGIVVTDLLTGDYDLASAEWQKTKKILNILGDTVATVTPFLVKGMLATNKSGASVAWLTNRKAFWRFMTAAFNKRDLFEGM